MAYPDKNPLQKLHNCPPFLAHALALATSGRRRMLLAEIVKRSGLTERTYLRTARKPDWDSVKLGVVEKFLEGTGVNPWRFRRQLRYLREHRDANGGFTLPCLTKKQQVVLDELCREKLNGE